MIYKLTDENADQMMLFWNSIEFPIVAKIIDKTPL